MAGRRIVLSRADFRSLVAGEEVKKLLSLEGIAPDVIVHLHLDLDHEPGMRRWSDPPEADELHFRRPRRRDG